MGTLPPIGGGNGSGYEHGLDSAGRERRALAGKLDIRDLSWEDREKVRTISTRKPPVCLHQLPQRSSSLSLSHQR
jgi:hypothetical protein